MNQAWRDEGVHTGDHSDRRTSASISFSGRTMGTRYQVTLVNAPAPVSQTEARRSLEKLLEKVESQMSTYRSDSELSRFNAASAETWFAVSPALAQVVSEGLHLSELTGGALDVTVDPLLRLWGFGPYPRTGEFPATAAIALALEGVGWSRLEVRAEPPALRKGSLPLTIDLSAVAKGFAVDLAGRYFESLGIDNYLVEIGGELKARGDRSQGRAWRVGIETPLDEVRRIHCIIELSDQSVATSGDNRNFFARAGRRYSHVLDPRSGYPISHALASVTVVHPSAMRADAWATALLVLGPEEGPALARAKGLAALFLSRTETGFSELATPEFERLRADQDGRARNRGEDFELTNFKQLGESRE